MDALWADGTSPRLGLFGTTAPNRQTSPLLLGRVKEHQPLALNSTRFIRSTALVSQFGGGRVVTRGLPARGLLVLEKTPAPWRDPSSLARSWGIASLGEFLLFAKLNQPRCYV